VEDRSRPRARGSSHAPSAAASLGLDKSR
jgi:hypothetical protein